MSVLLLEWYKEASREMLYYVNQRHFKVVTREMCSEFGVKKVTLVIAALCSIKQFWRACHICHKILTTKFAGQIFFFLSCNGPAQKHLLAESL